MLYDKETRYRTRGREQQTNSLRFTLVHPSYSSLSLFLSDYQNDEGKKEKEIGAPVARAGVYIYIYIAFEFSKMTPESCTRVTKG